MEISLETLPTRGGGQQDLVLLHGWGGSREIWRPLLPYLREWATVTLLDIPGLQPGVALPPDLAFDDLVEALLPYCPTGAVIVGHSLGGNLALALAERAPERVSAAITVATNLCFLAADQWPGMQAEQFADFAGSAMAEPRQTLQRFNSLQALGASDPRGVLRQLRAAQAPVAGAEASVGLRWLQSQDQRQLSHRLRVPQLHCLAQADALVPVEVGTLLTGAQIDVQIIDNCGHAIPLEQPARLGRLILTFLEHHGLCRSVPDLEDTLDKSAIATSFSRAAPSYDSLAVLQQDVGTRLLRELDAFGAASTGQETSTREGAATTSVVLDLGCGTGYFTPALRQRFPAAQHVGIDLAEGMVTHARGRHGLSGGWIVGDAEDLPLVAACANVVYSSLAIQWSQRPQRVFAELARVLKPGGKCVFTTLGPQTLKELREAWASVDTHTHVNDFLPVETLAEAAAGVPGVKLALQTRLVVMRYNTVRELLSELKGIGAHNMNRQRQAGLTSRRALQGMLETYELQRQDGQLPATYEVVFGLLERT